jgi:hypothetical protein
MTFVEKSTFLDRAKAAAERAKAAAQQGMQQGQAKLDAMAAKRRGETLLRDLGAAYYAEQRHDGSHEAVVRALAVVDSHVAEHGPVDTSAGPRAGTGSAA